MAVRNQAKFYTTGPCHLYVRTNNVGAGPFFTPAQLRASGEPIYFLGHTERTPEPGFETAWKPVFTSLSGEAVPDDELNLGTNCKLVLDLQRFDIDIIHMLMSGRHGRDIVKYPVGSESYLHRGRLLLQHGDSFELWVKYSFHNTANAQDDLPPGYYFLACRMAGIYPTNLTRDAKKVRLMIEPKPVRMGVVGGFNTFSKDPLYFNNLPDPG